MILKSMIIRSIFVFMLLLLACETRLPVDNIEFEEKLTLRLFVSEEAIVEAQSDTLNLLLVATDASNNIISLDGRDSTISITPTFGKHYQRMYFYDKELDTLLVDTIIAQFVYNDGLDTASDTLFVTVSPSESTIGSLTPDKISLSIRTDTVYMDGGWNMFIDALVSDSLGNPVKDGIPVFFTIDSSTIDTSELLLGNLVETGDTAVIDINKDQIPGNALNVLQYSSAAIGAMIIIKAQIQTDSTIVAYDTLKLPVPEQNLKLVISDRNGGVVEVPRNGEALAKFEVSLQDGFNKPIPYHYVNVSSLAGRIIPNAKVYNDDSTMVIGSTPAIIDSLEYDTLDNPYSGYTDKDGTFDLYIKMSSAEAPIDDKVKTMGVQVEVEEATTHHKETDFSFQVLFIK